MDEQVVTINVGGEKYSVSKTLVGKFPRNLLAQKAAGQWRYASDPISVVEIFIDRNGKRFEYVLDYMRHGRIALPKGVDKQALLMDMDFLRILVTNDRHIEDINAAQGVGVINHVMRLIIWILKEVDLEMKKQEQPLYLANYCIRKHMGQVTLGEKRICFELEPTHPSFPSEVCQLQILQAGLTKCNEYQARVGLAVEDIEERYSSSRTNFNTTLKVVY